MPTAKNRIQIIGNLGNDPEIRHVSDSSRVARLRVATSRRWTNADGSKGERTDWHTVVAWNGSADFAARNLAKGDRVYIEGEMQYRDYEARDGTRGFAAEIVSREIIPLSSSRKSESTDAPALTVAGSAANDEEEDPFEDLPF